MRRAALCVATVVLAAALAGGACRTAPAASAAADAAAAAQDDDRTLLVHALHRAARLRSGVLDGDAVAELADAVMVRLSGQALPLDAWQAVTGRDGRTVVIAVPDAGPLAHAVVSRLRLLAKQPGAVVLHEGGVPPSADPRAEVVVVARFALEAGPDGALRPVLAPVLDALRAGGHEPVVVFGDLLDPVVGSTRWAADVVLASQDAAAVLFDAEYTLRARAAGAVPDAGALAKARGLDLDALDWERIALAR